jgi:hypothetical protein
MPGASVPRDYEAAAPREGSKVSEAKPQVRNAVGLTVCEVMKPRTKNQVVESSSRRVVDGDNTSSVLRFSSANT